MKPGFKTTEFWVTATICVVCGIVSVIAFYHANKTWDVIGGITLLVGFIKAHLYDLNRVRLKIESLLHGCSNPPGPPPGPPPPPPPPPESNNIFVLRNADIRVKSDRQRTVMTVEIDRRGEHHEQKQKQPAAPVGPPAVVIPAQVPLQAGISRTTSGTQTPSS